VNITEDGQRYLAMSDRRVARPFHLRWLLPLICGTDLQRWTYTTRSSVLALAPLAWWYTGSVWMAACVLLPGVWFNWSHPVLVDATGMALALLSACLWPVCWPLALAVVLVGASVRETVPVWAAVFAWHPLLLIGLLAVGVRWLQRPGSDVCGPEIEWMLAHPIQSAKAAHAHQWRNPFVMLLPWAGLLAGLGAMTWPLAVAIGLAYGQLLIATDTTRLFQWAWPALALACVHAAPAWLPLVAVSVVFNPWQGGEI
jgi:hypothetical protein